MDGWMDERLGLGCNSGVWRRLAARALAVARAVVEIIGGGGVLSTLSSVYGLRL